MSVSSMSTNKDVRTEMSSHCRLTSGKETQTSSFLLFSGVGFLVVGVLLLLSFCFVCVFCLFAWVWFLLGFACSVFVVFFVWFGFFGLGWVFFFFFSVSLLFSTALLQTYLWETTGNREWERVRL